MTRRTVARAASLFLAGGLALMAPAPRALAVEPDTAPPVISTVVIGGVPVRPGQPLPVVEIDSGAAAIQLPLTFRATDASGVKVGIPEGRGTPSGFVLFHDTMRQFFGYPVSLVSGSVTDGLFSSLVRLPKDAYPGCLYTAYLQVLDVAENSTTFVPIASVRDVAVGDCEEGLGKAAVDWYRFSPAAVDTTERSQQVTLTMHLTGVAPSPTPTAEERWPRNHVMVSPPGRSNEVGGDLDYDEVTDTFSTTFTIPQNSPSGRWGISFAILFDDVTTRRQFDGTQDPSLPGDLLPVVTADSFFDVTGLGGDTSAPRVESFTLAGPGGGDTFDTSGGEQTLSFAATLSDVPGGVKMAVLRLRSVAGETTREVRLDPDAEGRYPARHAWSTTITLPEGSAPGVWTASLWVLDGVGNGRYLTAGDLGRLVPEATGLTLVNSADANAVTVDGEEAWQFSDHITKTSVSIAPGTTITRSGGGRFAFSELAAKAVADGLTSTIVDGEPVAAVRMGIDDLNLTFTNPTVPYPVTITMRVAAELVGQRFVIQSRSEDANASWVLEPITPVVQSFCSYAMPTDPTCELDNPGLPGVLTFAVNHATSFALVRSAAGAVVLTETPLSPAGSVAADAGSTVDRGLVGLALSATVMGVSAVVLGLRRRGSSS